MHLLFFLFSLAVQAAASIDPCLDPASETDVVAYARCCKKELFGDPDFKLPSIDLNCVDGQELPTTFQGALPSQANWKQIQKQKCDHRQWLFDSCDNYSFIRKVDLGSPDVDAVLLCRQQGFQSPDGKAARKLKYEAARGSESEIDRLREYAGMNNIAMIWSNRRNGKTCWFDSEVTSGLGQNSARFPMPDQTREIPSPPESHPSFLTAQSARKFWSPPRAVAQMNCVHCHDHGPWLHSPWIQQSGLVPPNPTPSKNVPYVNIGLAFRSWGSVYSVDTLPVRGTEKQKCTQCHAIGINASCGTLSDPPVVLRNWIKNANGWMPPNHGMDPEEWKKRFGAHVDAIDCCCRNPGARGCIRKNMSRPEDPPVLGVDPAASCI